MLKGLTGNVQQIIYDTKPEIVTASPTTGQTVASPNTSRDKTIWITPAGTLLNLTVTLPSEATSVVGQVVRIGTSQAITNLTINGATTILNTAVTLAINETVSYQKVAANTWVRI